MDAIPEAVKTYILEEILDEPEEIEASTPLISGGILDSIGSLKLVGFLEESYGISVEAHEVNVDNLDSLDAIHEFVKSKQG